MRLDRSNSPQIQAHPPPLPPNKPAHHGRTHHGRINRQRIVHICARNRQARGEREPDRQVDGPEQREDVDGRTEPPPHAPAAVLDGGTGGRAEPPRVPCVQQAAEGDYVRGVQAERRERDEGGERGGGGGADVQQSEEHHDYDGCPEGVCRDVSSGVDLLFCELLSWVWIG